MNRKNSSTVFHVSPKAYGYDWPRIALLGALVAVLVAALWFA